MRLLAKRFCKSLLQLQDHLAPSNPFRGCTTHHLSTRAQAVAQTPRRFVPSPEQCAIVEALRTQNVIVSARPGAGKTATAEAIVAANPDCSVAVITYSKRLQLETTHRLKEYPGCDVYTFHGLASKLFRASVYGDTLLHAFRKVGTTPAWTGQSYDIVILDEMQDCTVILFWLTCSFLQAITHAVGGNAPRIVTLGDERQAIYKFRGADPRYLTLASSTMDALSPHSWTQMTLSKSFRLSHQNARFINEVFLGGEAYITGSHDGPPPLYIRADLWNAIELADRLAPLIREYGYDQTAILSPSVRRNPTLSAFTNQLSKLKIPVSIPLSDDGPLDESVTNGKVCASTYHQFKGSERDLVIVYGADAGYFDYIGRDLPDDRCPNETFVALTRAIKQLVILQDQSSAPMPFLQIPAMANLVVLEDLGDDNVLKQQEIGRPIQLGLLLPSRVVVSDMARHVSDEILEAILNTHIHINRLASPLPSSEHIKAPDKTLTDHVKSHYEAVSDINGLAVVAAFEHAELGTLKTLGCTPLKTPDIPSEIFDQPAWLCRKACEYDARTSGYKSRSIQMKDSAFDWLGPYFSVARDRLRNRLAGAKNLDFEVKLKEENFQVKNIESHNINDDVSDLQQTDLVGRADIIQSPNKIHRAMTRSKRIENTTLWEIKFVGKLSLEHVVQVCGYAYLWAKKYKSEVLPRVRLFNVQDGEEWEIVAKEGPVGLRNLIEDVLTAKYTSAGEPSTEAFLKTCKKTREEVERLWEDR
jgi:superfamily I DNA/RNA helicase